MLLKNVKISFLKPWYCFLTICVLANTISFGATDEYLQMEQQEYRKDMNRIASLRKSFTPGPTNDLRQYEKFADEIQGKWSDKNKELYSRLMWAVCKPLSSGRFDDGRQHAVARRYALLALAEPNEVPIEVELELTGHVMTDMVTPRAPKGQDWARARKKDVEIRLHAWKRLIGAIEATWDPNDLPLINVTPPPATGLPSGVAPEAIKDPKLRAEYEAAIQKNSEKAQRYREQYTLRKWLRRFPKRAEEYIVRAYCKPPFNVEELTQYLEQYIADGKTRSRILDAVTRNMEQQTQNEPLM